MPLFVIEREFAEKLELTKEMTEEVVRINDDSGVRWLYSFLSADKKKTYCLYEAPTANSIQNAAEMANIPADVIIEVDKIAPETFV